MSEPKNKGEAVNVTLFGGEIVERLVWEDDGGEVLYLCTKRVYEKLLNDDFSLRPVGFPRSALVA